jgi:hypothetical protein
LLYLDTDETEVLGPADFERRRWRVRGGARAGKGADAAGGPRAAQGLAVRPWGAQLARLVAYKAEHGDCNVPKRWAEDPRLGNWVNTQRALKRKLDRGEPSKGMTAERAAKLDVLGFAWQLSAAAVHRGLPPRPRGPGAHPRPGPPAPP